MPKNMCGRLILVSLFFTAWDDSQGQSDIWVRDLATGAVHNLSNTSDRTEFSLHVWATQPNILLFESLPTGETQDGEAGGDFTVMKANGTGYEVVQPGNHFGIGVPSPDGQYIAFGIYYKEEPLWLYSSTNGLNTFPFNKFRLTNVNNVSIPVWSPDGKQIALWGTFKQKSKEMLPDLAFLIWHIHSGPYSIKSSQFRSLDHTTSRSGAQVEIG